VVLMVGIDQSIEGEGHDRTDTLLPGAQSQLVKAVIQAAAGKPIVVVLLNGGIVSDDALVEANVAIVEAWYPGVEGGRAIADALFGRTNRFGKLPVTIYRESFSKQVEMVQMSFTEGVGRTYKYWRGDAPLFNFGHGLSYTSFSLAWTAPTTKSTTVHALTDSILLDVTLTNDGSREGDEVVFVYHQPLVVDAPAPLPAKRVVAFKRFSLMKGATVHFTFNVSAADLGLVDNNGNTLLYPGLHALQVSRGHGDVLLRNLTVQTAAPLVIDSLPDTSTVGMFV